LLLVDGSGHLAARWLGALDFAQQSEAFRELGLVSTQYGALAKPQVAGVTVARVRSLLDSGDKPQILDIRPHSSFEQSHIAGAIDIPFDELPVRATHEVRAGGLVLIYCFSCTTCELIHRSENIAGTCAGATTILRSLGYRHVEVISADLTEISAAGIRVIGDAKGAR
jgi:hypothetical protein